MKKNKEEKTAEDHGLENFSSKIRKIYIPLPDFHFFHRPSEWNDTNPYFIGRKQIAEKLKNWLRDTKKNSTGAYLITGYRGMGKTSFVGKVIDEIMLEQRDIRQKNKPEVSWFVFFLAFSVLFLLYNYCFTSKSCEFSLKIDFNWFIEQFKGPFLKTIWAYCKIPLVVMVIGLTGIVTNMLYYLLRNLVPNHIQVNAFLELTKIRSLINKIVYSIITITPLFVVLIHLSSSATVNIKAEEIEIGVIALIFFVIFILSGINFSKTSRKYILNIKTNIGNEVSETKDILALLAYSIRKQVTEYIQTRSSGFMRIVAIRGIKWSVVAFWGILIFEHTLPLVEPAAQDFFNKEDKGMLLRALEALNTILYQFQEHHPNFAPVVGMALSCLVAYGIAKFIGILAGTLRTYVGEGEYGIKKIRQDLKHLCDRIDSSVCEDKDNAANNIGFPGFNMAFSHRKVKNYQPASIREIEQSLVRIIHDINTSKVLNCRMIIILDELDKLICQKNSEVPKESVYPEFTVDENGVSDDISVNEKKHKILGLLGQLKFFISTAEAKFIFIAGHELYDAYLADVSDREYSVSSIFNGVINVDSFFSCNQRTNDITRMTEVFLCKHLMSGSKENKKEDITEEEELERYNLKEYAKTIAVKNIWKQREKETVLAFLRQFVTYLAFMSNGAPQKLVTNFEKYIISEEDKRHKQNKQDITIEQSLLHTQASKAEIKAKKAEDKAKEAEDKVKEAETKVQRTEIELKKAKIRVRQLQTEAEQLQSKAYKEQNNEDPSEKVQRFQDKVKKLQAKAAKEGVETNAQQLRTKAKKLQDKIENFKTNTFKESEKKAKQLRVQARQLQKKAEIVRSEANRYEAEIQQIYAQVAKLRDKARKLRNKAKKNKQTRHYLSFSYRDQQKIGFIHHMANPVFENMISPSSEFGDKLLIASSFLIAHIYKYHNSGFSRRNLEYMPELLDSNRSPELRSFIDSILWYLGQIHLSPITLGIYSYKFPMRLAEEISVFSKKSEEVSAVFNFSLDDSLAVKKFYYRLFDFYHQNQKGSEAIKGAFHHNLGDIHLASNEYTEAIAQYRSTAQTIESVLQKQLQQKNQYANIGMVAMQVMRYTRVMLKTGLAYEKRNSLDSAYLIYNTLTSRLISFREINEKKIGLEQKIVKSKSNVDYGIDGRRVLMIERAGYWYPADEYRYYLETERDEDYKDLVCWTYGDELVDNLSDRLSPLKYALISKLSVFEDLQLAFLPILAKLFAMEKHNVCGITKDNIKVADAEFRHLFQVTNSKEKYLLQVDFYRKLGDILYYKNGSLFRETSDSVLSIVSDWGYDLKSAIFDYCYRNNIQKCDFEKIINRFKIPYSSSVRTTDQLIKSLVSGRLRKVDVKGIVDEFPDWLHKRWNLMKKCYYRRTFRTNKNSCCTINVPCVACGYYNRSLMILVHQLTNKGIYDQNNAPFILLQALKEKKLSTWRSNDLTQAALTLLAMGNVLLSCSYREDIIRESFISSLFNSEKDWEGNKVALKRYGGHLERAILHYWVAMQYFNKTSNHKEGVQCLIWIFNILVGYMSEGTKEGYFLNAWADMESVVMRALRQIHAMRDNSGLREINKMRDILEESDTETPKINLGLTSIMPDAEELLLAYYEVLLYLLAKKSSRSKYLKIIGDLYHSPSLTYMRNDSLTYNRVLVLLFKVKLNERLLRLLGKLASAKAPQEKHFKIYNKLFNNVLKSNNEVTSTLKKDKDNVNPEDLLRFLISDSIFCLATIVDFLQPTARTSLFSNSFCFSIYDRLYNWVQWKEWFEQYYDGVFKDLLKQDIGELLEDHHHCILKKTYLRKMSDKYYAAARSMHSEGSEYQNFINGMFLLDDDLQNNTCQFYFALERYKIRSVKNGTVPRSSYDGTKMKSGSGRGHRTSDEYFDPASYFGWPIKAKTRDEK